MRMICTQLMYTTCVGRAKHNPKQRPPGGEPTSLPITPSSAGAAPAVGSTGGPVQVVLRGGYCGVTDDAVSPPLRTFETSYG